jgi:hypothetical protein
MLPNQLSPESFAKYPPEARRLATEQIALLRRLPLAYLPLLLRELIVYDWKFPAERNEVNRQFRYLGSLADGQFQSTMSPFTALKLTSQLEQVDWVNNPAVFSEQLSAHLWSTHQIDSFTGAAVEYMKKVTASAPDAPLATHRLGIAVIGQGVAKNDSYRLFRKLRRNGVYYTQVKPAGIDVLLAAAGKRAESHPAPYGHWYIDGGAALATPAGMTCIAYNALAAPRAAIQARMQKTYEAPVFDPEAFRTMLAQMKPEEAGLSSDNVLSRFQLSLLTEGSGTQVFSTTFVQWAAREALRRAQPLTMITRYAPRQREKQMNELLAERQHAPELDPQGSLVDADMGAWYTWINQQRLSGDDQSAFLAWFEDHGEAVAIAPKLDRGTTSSAPIDLADLVARLA